MNSIHFKKFIPGIAWFFVVLFLMCLPGSDLPSVNWSSKIYLDKWVHVALFAGLTFLFCWPLYNTMLSARQKVYSFIRIALAVSIWGLTTEFIQKFFVTGREFDLLDWVADSLGALLAFLFCKKKFI